MALLLAALSGYCDTVLLETHFEPADNDTVGQLPAGLGVYCSPGQTIGSNRTVVVGSPTNTAGTGQGVEIVDDDGATGTRFEYQLAAPLSVMRFDFSFSPARADGTGVNYFNAAVMPSGLSSGTSANRFCVLRLYDNNSVRFYGGNVPGAVGSFVPVFIGKAYRVSMFLNDLPTPTTYTDPNGVSGTTLAADSAAFWLSGTTSSTNYVSYGSAALQGAGTGISAGTNGLGRVGFGSTTAAVELDYYIDDIKITKIVPPPGPGDLSLYLLGE